MGACGLGYHPAMSRMKARMLAGELYLADDPQLLADLARAQGLTERYNRTGHGEQDERDGLLRELLAGVGEGVVVRPAFRCDWEYGLPTAVGDNVWLGGGAIVCPSVTIGADTVVGAGAVVTRDLPAGVVALGVPARPVREIGDRDRVEPPDRWRRPRRALEAGVRESP